MGPTTQTINKPTKYNDTTRHDTGRAQLGALKCAKPIPTAARSDWLRILVASTRLTTRHKSEPIVLSASKYCARAAINDTMESRGRSVVLDHRPDHFDVQLRPAERRRTRRGRRGGTAHIINSARVAVVVDVCLFWGARQPALMPQVEAEACSAPHSTVQYSTHLPCFVMIISVSKG